MGCVIGKSSPYIVLYNFIITANDKCKINNAALPKLCTSISFECHYRLYGELGEHIYGHLRITLSHRAVASANLRDAGGRLSLGST